MLQLAQRFALMAVAFTIPFPTRVNSIVAVVASVVCILPNIGKRPVKILLSSPLCIMIIAHLLILLVGLTYSPDSKQGLADVERFSFAVLLTIMAFYMRDSGVRIRDLVAALALGCGVVIIYGFVLSLFVLDEKARVEALSLGHTYFTDHVGVHPTYLTLYLSFVFFFLIEYWKHKRHALSRQFTVYTIVILVLIIGTIFFLRSQMALIVFVLMGAMYALTLLKRRAAMVVFFLTSVALLVYLVDDQRVHTFFDSYGKNVSTALDHRRQVWEGAVISIARAPVFGQGTGGEQVALNRAYEETGFTEGIERSYNAHNQYLSFMLRNGIVELVCFLVLLFFCFRTAIDLKNQSFLIFLMMFALTQVTESCLDVQKGVVFFYFFVAVWLYIPDELATSRKTE